MSLDQALTVAEVHTLGEVVSGQTLHRYTTTGLGFGHWQPTTRVADGEPGAQLQMRKVQAGAAGDVEDLVAWAQSQQIDRDDPPGAVD